MHFSNMVNVASATFLAGVVAQTTGKLGNAPIVSGNPTGVSYAATLPATAFWKTGSLNGNVKGSISAKTAADGVGVEFTVNFSNLPKEGGPFIYHIHAAPVPDSGNCTATLAHLDPYQRGEDPVCDSSAPETCQTGDLSGKHGKVQTDPFTATYTDKFLATVPTNPSFFGNLSFVFHFANKTRITCANFAKVSNATTTVTATGSAIPTSTYTTVPVTAGAALTNAKAALKFAAAPLAGLLFML